MTGTVRLSDIAVDEGGSVFVLDGGFGRIVKYSGTGALLRQWNVPAAGGFDIDSQGNVLVPNTAGQTIFRYSNSGTFLESWNLTGYYPSDLAIGLTGDVFVATWSAVTGVPSITRLTAAGTFVTRWDANTNDQYISADADGGVLYGFGDLVRYDETGNVVGHWIHSSSPPTNGSAHAAVSPDGTIQITGGPIFTGGPASVLISAPQGAQVDVPAVAYPSIQRDSCTTTVELRQPSLPQGFTIGVHLPSSLACPGASISSAQLYPRSGTGPVFTLIPIPSPAGTAAFQSYFLIDNLMAPGFYDLKLTCSNGAIQTFDAQFKYNGFPGYVSSGTIKNSVTGNVLRGARVSIWQFDGSGYEWLAGQISGDGTYSFTEPPGTYKILVQYELAGEQWRGPFTVSAPAGLGQVPASMNRSAVSAVVPPEDILVVPLTADTTGPVYSELVNSGIARQGVWKDSGVGLALIEAVPESLVNVAPQIPKFRLGSGSVQVGLALLDTTKVGRVTLRAQDQLGNTSLASFTLQALSLAAVPPRESSTGTLEFTYAGPSPLRHGGLSLHFSVKSIGLATIRVIDAAGRVLSYTTDEVAAAGSQTLELKEPTAIPPGIYFVEVSFGGTRAHRKICILGS
jgi:hypothetical protein